MNKVVNQHSKKRFSMNSVNLSKVFVSSLVTGALGFFGYLLLSLTELDFKLPVLN